MAAGAGDQDARSMVEFKATPGKQAYSDMQNGVAVVALSTKGALPTFKAKASEFDLP